MSNGFTLIRAFAALLTFAFGGLAFATGLQAQSLQATAPATRAAQVSVDNFTFSPPTLTVTAGTTVTWTNADDIPHTIVAQDHSFRSKALDTDGSFSFTFTAAGEYDYFCSLHPHMVGKIIVKASGASPS
ncbi:cupredoxin domain-containing protein [Microvirga massiliensis]|uniref:cupredoxin domain-containing protein n=1 Tax=Microvirga massiliensis TaxID=1033741 RepID=UPI0009E3BF68|nr:cupredoxin family copper-binding protein [Microvirga massiliensis]